MYVHCMYGLGSNPVPKRNIRITFGLGSDRFSPIAIQNQCAYGFGSHLDVGVCTYNVCTGPSVQCTYISVRILYLNEIDTVNTVNDLF